ncbi:hypothetical protein GWK47_023139 [Chionoecetes opilio]|uniref:Uncharacterized protein n=1 Tax=Chionoecetes opilio TaxID=41210 RepID=A0A8J4XMQ4_CHIOP|nr:hypothetical protein GWK47_023139 [Chionoecetes opilio]
MASQRPRLSTPHRRRQPARHHTSPTQRALQDVLAGMASLVHGTRAPTVTRTPAPVTLEKCEMEITAAEFRTWRRSVSWVALTGWSDNAATLHIRLNCISPLQRAINARYSADRREQLSPREALDAIAGIVLQIKRLPNVSLSRG